MHQKCEAQFVDAMNVTIAVHRKYIHRSKANDISFRSMYIFSMYDHGNIHRVDKLYNMMNLMMFIIIENTVSIVVHRKYVRYRFTASGDWRGSLGLY